MLNWNLDAIGGPLSLATTVWLFAKYFVDHHFRQIFPLRPERYRWTLLVEIPFIIAAVAVQNDIFIKLSLTVMACFTTGVCIVSVLQGRPIRGFMSKMAPKGSATRIRLFYFYFVCVFALEAGLNTLVALQVSTDIWVLWRIAIFPLFIVGVSLPPAVWFTESDKQPRHKQTTTV